MKSGLIAVIGRPNVGKSTLLNRLINEKLAIVSPKPQTTWQRLHGILTTGDTQFVFIDTPGIETERTSGFIASLKKIAVSAMDDADVAYTTLFRSITQKELALVRELKRFGDKPRVLLVNKTDTKKDKRLLLPVVKWYADLAVYSAILPASARTGDGIDALLAELKKHMPTDGMLYGKDMITDRYERELAAELIREKLFHFTKEEVPYSSVCTIDRFDESERDRIIRIYATVFVEKPSQKGIVIGASGSMIKKIGTSARLDIERLLGTKVYLELHVKVKEGWKKDRGFLREMGLDK
ncbi:MAG: GTPase Era [Deltaproteobacteria bacterium]|nr:GTPase Era [Deltaproteobacteria bacterium]